MGRGGGFYCSGVRGVVAQDRSSMEAARKAEEHVEPVSTVHAPAVSSTLYTLQQWKA